MTDETFGRVPNSQQPPQQPSVGDVYGRDPYAAAYGAHDPYAPPAQQAPSGAAADHAETRAYPVGDAYKPYADPYSTYSGYSDPYAAYAATATVAPPAPPAQKSGRGGVIALASATRPSLKVTEMSLPLAVTWLLVRM